jgi:hypothetical protein
MKNIVITSNPFGFGPTGKAVEILKKILENNYFRCFNVYFLGSGICLEILEKDFINKGLKVVEIDERNIGNLEVFLATLKGKTLCVGFQNKFIPVAAKNLGIKSFFVDGLAWFWENTPESHFVADQIYWTNFLNIHFKDKEIPSKVKLIGTLHSSINRCLDHKNRYIIVSLGGAKNPLVGGLQEDYLKLAVQVFASLANQLSINIEMVAGLDACKLMKEYNSTELKNNYLSFKNYSHDVMMNKFSGAEHHFSVGGQTSSMEALSSKVPTSFYLPSNLSQVRFQEYIDKYVSKNLSCNWELFRGVDTDMIFDEKHFISYINKISGELVGDQDFIKKCVSRCVFTMNQEMSNIFKIFDEMNSGGGDILIEDIKVFFEN